MASHSSTATDPYAAGKHPSDGESHMEGGEAHASLKGYLTGFVLSVIMTAIPFWLVMARPIEDGATTVFLVVGFAVAQIFVHMIYFLHMDAKSEGGWTIMALIFTMTLVIITISGSLWVMYHLNTNMMPMGEMQMNEGMGSDETSAPPTNQLAPISGDGPTRDAPAPTPDPLRQHVMEGEMNQESSGDAANAPASSQAPATPAGDPAAGQARPEPQD